MDVPRESGLAEGISTLLLSGWPSNTCLRSQLTQHRSPTHNVAPRGDSPPQYHKATWLMVNARHPIDLFVQDLPRRVYTWLQALTDEPVHSVLTLTEFSTYYTYQF